MLDRRRFLALLTAAAAAQACGTVGTPSRPTPPGTSEPPDELDAIAEKILSGGPPPDGIPPIEKPQYVSAAEASLQWKDDAVVEGLVVDGQPRAYPRFITVWHEIVNETIAGRPVAITYCPLTGSAVVFAAELSDGRQTTFGTSGKLYNSNLVMYDRATTSMWPQLLGVAVSGERKGERLRELPLAVTTTFGRWKARHPDTVVLSTETGHLRTYGSWPYGDYDTSSGIMFPVEPRDERYHPKAVVVGVRAGGEALAIPKEEFAARRVANVDVGGEPLVALHDPALESIRVFRRDTGRGQLRFALRGDAVIDEQTGSRWSPEGHAADGELAGVALAPVVAYDVMWFAWFGFNPATKVLA
ncbi:MAG: DUF3179 domain-containing protein [Candidatus Limnocylindria bacterium]